MSETNKMDKLILNGQHIDLSPDYQNIRNKPKINGVNVEGNKTLADFGIATKESVETVSEKVANLPYGIYYGQYNDVESLPDASKLTQKGYAYVATTDDNIFYIYTYNGEGYEWEDSGNKFDAGSLEDNLESKSTVKAPTTKVVAESIEGVDLTKAKTASTELTPTQKYNANANISNRIADVEAETGVVKSLGYKVLNPAMSFAEQVTAANTIYEVKDEFNLEGINVTEVEKQCTVSTDISSTSTPDVYYIDNTPIVIETGKGVCLPVGCVLLNSGKTAVSYSTITAIYITNGTYYVASKTSGTYTINLYEDIVTIPSNCTLKFNGGKLKNGTLGGNSMKLDGDIRFGEDIVIAGTYEKKNSLTTSIFDGDYDGVDLIKNIGPLANNLELLDGEVIDVDKVGTTIQLNSIYSKGYATINFKYKTAGAEGLRISNNVGFILRNLNITEDYPTTASTSITLGSAFVITTSSVGNKTYDLVIENCNFSGRYNSSCLSASNLRSCLVKNCKWTDTIANDHYVYCSTNIKSYTIENCEVSGGFSFGAFKVRNSSGLDFNCNALKVSNGYNGYVFTLATLEKSNICIQNTDFDGSIVSAANSQFANLSSVSEINIKIANSSIKLNSNASRALFNPGTTDGLLTIEVVNSIIVGEICQYGDIIISNSHLTKTSNAILFFGNSIKIDNSEIHLADRTETYSGVFRFYNAPSPLLSIKNSKVYTRYNGGNNKVIVPLGFVQGNATASTILSLIIENTYIEQLSRSLIYSYVGDVNLYLKGNDITTGPNYDPLFNTFTGTWLNRPYGISANRPTLNSKNIANVIGYSYYDTTLKKPIFWSGTAWVDANGETVGLQVSDTSVLIGAAAGSTKTVSVYYGGSTAPTITVLNSDDTANTWLTATPDPFTGNTLTLTADANDTSAPRGAKVLVTLGNDDLVIINVVQSY